MSAHVQVHFTGRKFVTGNGFSDPSFVNDTQHFTCKPTFKDILTKLVKTRKWNYIQHCICHHIWDICCGNPWPRSRTVWRKQVKSSWCQSVAHGCFLIRLLLTQLYLTVFAVSDMMTLKYVSSRSSRIKFHRASRKPTVTIFYIWHVIWMTLK